MKQRKNSKPNLFQYHDYRSFLRDLFEFYREKDSSFSTRKLSEKAKLAAGYLPMVLQGKRPLSGKALKKLAPHLGMTQNQGDFLELLCELSDGETLQLRHGAFQKMQKFPAYRRNHPQEYQTHRYLTHWYYVAIREIADLKNGLPPKESIQKMLRFKISQNEIQQAIKFLIDHEFLTKDNHGKWVPAQQNLECFGGVYRLVLGQFHREMLSLASDSIDTVPSEERRLLGQTLAVSQSTKEQIFSILENAREQIARLSDETEPDETEEIFHAQFIAFPLTRKEPNDEKS